MAFYTDGEVRQWTLSLASILLRQLKFMPKVAYQDWISIPPLSQQLSEWLRTVGSPTSEEAGEDSMSLNGTATEIRSIEMLREMLQSVRTHIKENGFPEKDPQPVVSVEVRHITSDDMLLSIRLKIEKASFG